MIFQEGGGALNSFDRDKQGFTLAEVLITLGIIGIVASMTLPALIQQNQKKVTATRLEQTYSQLYQAINMAQAKYGDMKNWDVNENYKSSNDASNPNLSKDMAAKFAETYITPYIKHTGTPQVIQPRELGYSDYRTKNGQIYWNAGTSTYILELANGVTLFIAYNGDEEILLLPIIFVDINGRAKPNIVGRDFFLFTLDSVSTMKLKPYGIDYKREKLLEDCSSRASSLYGNLNCTGLIVIDGWEIKDDYPW